MSAVDEIKKGLFDANLGGYVYKKRIALNGRGKRGGVRTLLAHQVDSRSVFMYGFAKNKRENITEKELAGLKYLAKLYLNYTSEQIKKALYYGELIEVIDK